MKAKDLEQGKYYASVEYLSENVERYRRWYITLREGNNIRANVVEQINDASLSFYADFVVNYDDKDICFYRSFQRSVYRDSTGASNRITSIK